MNALDQLYARMLQLGFVVLQQAVDSGDADWVRAEVALLHNVPTLLGEENLERHRYFWEHERELYLEWLREHGTADAESRMRTYYQPLWEDMEPLIADRIPASGETSRYSQPF
jgi:hypothetical protein